MRWGDIYRVSFVGCFEPSKREILLRIEERLEDIAEELILMHRMVEFRLCRDSELDLIASSALKRALKACRAEKGSLILVLSEKGEEKKDFSEFYDYIERPIIPKEPYTEKISLSHRWLVHNSDLILTYAEKNTPEAQKIFEYAERAGVDIYNIEEELGKNH